MRILVAYATAHGSTAEVAKYIGQVLEEHGHIPHIMDMKDAHESHDILYDAYFIGTAIHGGEWLPEAYDFLNLYSDELAKKPVFCWVSCIRVLENRGYDWVLNNYLPPWLLQKVNLYDVTAFAGKLNLKEISFEEEWALALKYDGHHSAVDFEGDFRDWQSIRLWTQHIALQLDDNHSA
jgi:menaquinone-dependent protoporphyrinogen oxidase